MWAGLADLTISMSLDYNELPWLGTGDLNALTSLGYCARLFLKGLWRRCVMRSLVLLCVDDSPKLLQVRKASFEHLGFSVVTATSVATALAVLEKMAIDAVLMDYKPEGMDSEAVAFHIKHRFPQQPIILLSAFSEMPQRILWLVDEYVMRGEPPERIVQVIDALTRSRARMASAEDVKHHRTAA